MSWRTVPVALACALGIALGAAPAGAAEVETRAFETRAADGTALRGHVTLPAQANRPLATVLHYSPYYDGPGHGFEGTETFAESSDELSFLLEAGFAVASVSMRGTGKSEGCLRFGDETDWQDAATVIQALAAQPWSNGNIGMYGHSYPGWSQMMAMAAGPPALKGIVPTSGVFDLWSLLTRRGAPLTGGLGTLFPVAFTGTTGHQPPQGINQLSCPDLYESYRDNAQLTVDGDRTEYFQQRDLRDRVAGSAIPMMASLGIVSGVNDGHIEQLDGMWARLRPDRTRFVLGQWSHETPTDHKAGWHDDVVGWFDHYLRGGPQRVKPGVVEYQDDVDLRWHETDRWPPPATRQTLHLSGSGLVADGEPVEEVDASLQSADNDPGLKTDQPDERTRLYNSTCGPTQALFASRPLAEDVLLAGHATVELDLASTLPGGNLAVFLWRTKGDGTCPDQSASWFGRAQMDLRHWETAGRSRDFPVGTPTPVRLESHPMAANLKQGERIVVAIGGGSSELEPDARHPRLTVSGGSIRLPVVEGSLRFVRFEG